MLLVAQVLALLLLVKRVALMALVGIGGQGGKKSRRYMSLSSGDSWSKGIGDTGWCLGKNRAMGRMVMGPSSFEDPYDDDPVPPRP